MAARAATPGADRSVSGQLVEPSLGRPGAGAFEFDGSGGVSPHFTPPEAVTFSVAERYFHQESCSPATLSVEPLVVMCSL